MVDADSTLLFDALYATLAALNVPDGASDGVDAITAAMSRTASLSVGL